MPHRVLDKYFEVHTYVYGQTAKITPEAGEKGSFFRNKESIKYIEFLKTRTH